MKKDSQKKKKQPPRPVALADQDPNSSPDDTASSIVTPGDSGDHGNPLSSVPSYMRRFLVCDDRQLMSLSPAHQACAEPLLSIADRVRSDWPEKPAPPSAPSSPLLRLISDFKCSLTCASASR
jgi:hypothetical protein